MNKTTKFFSKSTIRKIDTSSVPSNRRLRAVTFPQILGKAGLFLCWMYLACDPHPDKEPSAEEGSSSAEVIPTTTISEANTGTEDASNTGTTTQSSSTSSGSSDTSTTTSNPDTGSSSTDIETDSSSETSESDASDTETDGEPPEGCPPHPDFRCKVEYDCENKSGTDSKTLWVCGALNSPLDDSGCMRPKCLTHQDCVTGTKCFSDYRCNEDGCTRSGMDCSDERGGVLDGICECSGADDCSGEYGWCVPEAIYECPLEKR